MGSEQLSSFCALSILDLVIVQEADGRNAPDDVVSVMLR